MADFRRSYHVSYLDVPTGEAVALASMLREGSEYVRALDPHLAWGDEERLLADVVDAVSRLTHMLSEAGTTEGAPRVLRPGDREDGADMLARATEAGRAIEETEWEEADV